MARAALSIALVTGCSGCASQAEMERWAMGSWASSRSSQSGRLPMEESSSESSSDSESEDEEDDEEEEVEEEEEALDMLSDRW